MLRMPAERDLDGYTAGSAFTNGVILQDCLDIEDNGAEALSDADTVATHQVMTATPHIPSLLHSPVRMCA